MKFYGISMIFPTENNQQYNEIGNYWDYFSNIIGRENLKGLGLNWGKNSLEYIIGDIDKKINFNLEEIRKEYPNSQYKEIPLPKNNWITYHGRTEQLSNMYNEIYKDGNLTYEIETFNEDGSCCVKIYRD